MDRAAFTGRGLHSQRCYNRRKSAVQHTTVGSLHLQNVELCFPGFIADSSCLMLLRTSEEPLSAPALSEFWSL